MKRRLSLAAALLAALALAGAALAVDAVSIMTGGAASSAASAPASADTQAPADNSGLIQPFTPVADADACNARRDEIDKLLKDWNALKTEDAAKRFSVTEEQVTRRIETLTNLKNTYPAIINALSLKSQNDADLAKKKQENESDSLTLTDKPPYTLKYYDSYIDVLDDRQKQVDSAQEDLDHATASAEAARKLVEDREAAWRLARDNYQKEANADTTWALRGASFLLESARAQLLAAQLIKSNAEDTLALRKLGRADEASVQKYIRDNLALDEKSFTEQINALNADIDKLEKSRPALSAQLRTAEAAAEAALLKYTRADTDDAKAAAAFDRERALAERDKARSLLEHLQDQLIIKTSRKRNWTLRYDLARGAVDKASIPDLVKQLADERQQLEDNQANAQKDLLVLQAHQSTVQKQLEAETDAGKQASLRKLRAALQANIDSYLDYVGRLISLSAQERAFIAELQETYKTVSVLDKAKAWWATKGTALLNTELWQSNGYGVRLREFLIALALIVLGIWGARRAIALLVWLLSKHFKFDETSQRSIGRLLFYIAGAAIVLGALQIVGIPLTAFAFLGGAVAIAIGFGTQNLFKNLISGILLAVKRPFRIGNVVEVGGVCGVVTDIGVSSTLIRQFDEKEAVVPNSSLLENQLINWSLSNSLLRCQIDFGVEYGTSAKLVRETTVALALSHDEVMKNPAPWVYFGDFGDSALEFSLFVWINQRTSARMRVCSQLREMIQEKFNELNIGMAYPHMDVSLLSAPVLRHQALPPQTKKEASAEAAAVAAAADAVQQAQTQAQAQAHAQVQAQTQPQPAPQQPESHSQDAQPAEEAPQLVTEMPEIPPETALDPDTGAPVTETPPEEQSDSQPQPASDSDSDHSGDDQSPLA